MEDTREYFTRNRKYYWENLTTSGAPIEVVRKYIENQGVK